MTKRERLGRSRFCADKAFSRRAAEVSAGRADEGQRRHGACVPRLGSLTEGAGCEAD